MSRVRLIQGVIVVLATLLSGCMHPSPIAAPSDIELTPLRTVSGVEARALLALAGVKGISVKYAVDCYRMTYFAPGPRGETVRLSGLLALPRGVAPRRLVSFQHGTTTTRNAVPSQPDQTGLAAAIAFAGNGYALIAPDYPGLGESAGRHPYYVADAIAPAVVAMIDAAERIPGVGKAPVFLSGFSEGGWASLAAVRMLEARGERVLGSAQVAGAYDLRQVSLPAAMKGHAPQHALYLAYLAWAYADRYVQPLGSVLTPEYAATVGRLFSGGATPDEIVKGLPADPRRMFNQAFLDAFDHGGPHWFLDAIAANSLIDVSTHARLRLYYGSKDMDVTPEESRIAAQTMRARGADVIALDVGPIGHDDSMLAAAPLILKWLGELDAAAR
jgi:pimeloyl-ACP methyl ester carboxylesterase